MELKMRNGAADGSRRSVRSLAPGPSIVTRPVIAGRAVIREIVRGLQKKSNTTSGANARRRWTSRAVSASRGRAGTANTSEKRGSPARSGASAASVT